MSHPKEFLTAGRELVVAEHGRPAGGSKVCISCQEALTAKV
jgi:hypothetical protein